MKCKIVAVLVVSVVTSFVCGRMLFAQYTGGSYDGYAMGSFPGTFYSYYTGGSYDGYAIGSFTGILYDRPSVTTGSATSVTTSSAILNGTVSTNGTTTTALFQYGIASGTYTGTSTQTTITGSSTSAVSSTVSSLSPTRYIITVLPRIIPPGRPLAARRRLPPPHRPVVAVKAAVVAAERNIP